MKLLKLHSVSLTNRWRECLSRDYDSRRVVANFSDGGSNPPRSTIQGFEEHLSKKKRVGWRNPIGFFVSVTFIGL